MKTFEVEVRIRNNRLKQHRLESGYRSQPALAKAAGVSVGMISALESMSESPLAAHGGWKPSALKLAEFFGVGPDELFPPETHAPGRTAATKRLDADEIQGLLQSDYTQQAVESPEAALARQEQHAALHAAVDRLPPRRRRAVELYFGLNGNEEMTLAGVGEELGITRETVRMLIDRSLHAIRKPSNADLSFADDTICKHCRKPTRRSTLADHQGYCISCWINLRLIYPGLRRAREDGVES